MSPAERRQKTTDFTLSRLESGETWNFADQSGKVVVVNYWATWCGPCRIEIPGFVTVANDDASRGLEIVGVAMDENVADIPSFVEKYHIPYKILHPGNDPNIGNGTFQLPTTFSTTKTENSLKNIWA